VVLKSIAAAAAFGLCISLVLPGGACVDIARARHVNATPSCLD